MEKILDNDEALETSWPVEGTTGYDFMDQVAALLHDSAGAAILNEIWQRVSGDPRDFAGFTLGEADELRKVMGKKQKDKIPVYKEKFIKGAVATSEVTPQPLNVVAGPKREARLRPGMTNLGAVP